MKQRLSIWVNLLFVGSALFLAGCQKNELGGIAIDFHNASGKTLNNLSVNGQPLGTLSNGKSSGVRRFDAFGTDSGMPDCQIEATVDDQLLEGVSTFFWCVTEKSALKPGRYTIEITLSPWTSYNEAGELVTSDYLYLQFK
ncbi:hypothetical protein JHJ32_16180 [Parapedobacter sp. ISTM3]|uniref:hypothetical protein n=1 Tax=Parapedobacter sp. ISTM3 TaxID=2800130 RepID=UPI001908FC4A|nr:hypothetical protein [Parapedobacter sp. ISTM3]MBK1441537.1 hypothetical protein [Parapedobacter sp. ISTM3]